MKIGEIAKKLDTTVQAIRYYEREGLITARRNQAGTRYFLDEDVIRLKVIRNLVELGIPLASLKTLATTRVISRTGDESSHSVAAQIDKLSRALKDQRSAIDRTIADLSKSKKVIRDCYQCSKKPIRKNCEPCPVFKNVHRADINQLIWEQSDEGDTS